VSVMAGFLPSDVMFAKVYTSLTIHNIFPFGSGSIS
jgi:hypothetical protein